MSAVDVRTAAAHLVARSTSAQGLPEQVEDAAVLARVAAIIHSSNGSAGPIKAGATATTATVAKRGGRFDGTC